MTEKIATVVVGAGGAMGQTLVRAALEADDIEIVGATDAPGAPHIGQPLSAIVPGAPSQVTLTDDPLPVFAKAQAILDFTVPAATVAHAALAAQARAVHVIGTTGLADDDLAKIAAAARHATIVRAGNMSLGVNLLTALTQKVASALGLDFDIEIVEMHHHRKVDAPSGTALMLGEAAAKGRGAPLNDLRDSGRDGITGARKRGDIGFAALRGGDVVGEHEVIFAGMGERITLKHIATDRMLFARGAIAAARWGQGRGPGEFDMMDVLGLS